ncbi:MAG: hypothetical protein ABEJ06_04905, partial [Haloarculaceae archaeon]
METVKLSRLRGLLDSLDYPLTNARAREAVEGVTLVYADGEEPLDDVVGRSNAESFADAADLEAEIYTNLPVEAVGEPGQSEGEG